LDNLDFTDRLTSERLIRAKKYAFHFFFRRMIPLEFTRGGQGTKLELDISSLKDLLPGKHLGLDVICDGILSNQPFIYPAEDLL
jgi:hypothetical protein